MNLVYGRIESIQKYYFNKDVLVSVKTLMDNETRLIITTPNIYAYHRIKLIFNRQFEEHWLNPEHVCWYSFQALKQLLLRKEFSIEFEVYYASITRKERNLKYTIKTLLN